MAKYVRLLNDCLGLNNAVSPTKGKYNPESGAGELSVAVNVNILDDGAIERRDGLVPTALTGVIQTIWSGNNGTFFVKSGALYKLTVVDGVYTSTFLQNVIGGEVSYCDVLDKTYFCTGFERGIIQGVSIIPWTFDMATEYKGPSTFKLFTSPPIGSLLTLYNGRMYIAVDNVLVFSEPFGYSMYDYARSYIWFEHNIIAIREVRDGIYVSTEKEVFFLGGDNPQNFVPVKVSNYPVIRGTVVQVTGDSINLQPSAYSTAKDKVLLWTSQNGIYLGVEGGVIKNITFGRLVLPTVNSGCAVFYNGRYIVFLSA